MTDFARHGADVPVRTPAFDVDRVRNDFPLLRTTVHGHPLVYLDNAATTQKPQAVIDAVRRYYEEENANVHRGVHYLSERATTLYEAARDGARQFLKAARREEIVFVRGATEGINLVAQSFGRQRVQPGDEVLISGMEHHSNIVPWQILCREKGASLRIVPINDRGELEVDRYESLLTERVRIVALTHVSNALGTVNPVKELVAAAHQQGIPVLLDGAQAVPHFPVDVTDLDCDFYVFSGHKLFGPTGIGILYGKATHLESMPPYQGGGDMIKSVTFEKTVFNDIPYKFEAGTPNIAGVVGLGEALRYVDGLDFAAVQEHEQDVLRYATEKLASVEGLRIIGTAERKAGVASFVMEAIHPHDIGTVLDADGVAIRTGHHCAQPIMERYAVPATARASFAFYNTRGEVDRLVSSLQRVREVFG